MIDGVLHYAFSTADITRTLDFYCGLLGFEYLFELLDENGKPKTFYTRLNRTQFFEFFLSRERFGAQPETRPGSYPCGFHHVCLRVADLNAVAERLTAASHAFTRDGAGLWTTSPDGDLLRIVPESTNDFQGG